MIKVFFAEIKYGVHRSNGNICVRVVLVFFGGNLDLRKCKFLTDVLFKSGADFVQFSAVW